MITINKFIERLQQISEDKRELPLVVICPNGLEVDPNIKMMFGRSIFGDKVEKMVITWQD